MAGNEQLSPVRPPHSSAPVAVASANEGLDRTARHGRSVVPLGQNERRGRRVLRHPTTSDHPLDYAREGLVVQATQGKRWKPIKGKTEDQRFWEKVDKSGPVPECAPALGPCWTWMAGGTAAGYGQFRARGKARYSHRWSYEKVHGPIPPGLHLDHLCRNTWCCNPTHLEAVTPEVNILRGVGVSAISAAQTHCAKGHELKPENLVSYGKGRRCRPCNLEWQAERRERRRAAI